MCCPSQCRHCPHTKYVLKLDLPKNVSTPGSGMDCTSNRVAILIKSGYFHNVCHIGLEITLM